MEDMQERVYRYWTDRAAEHKDSWRAGSNDPILSRLEIAALKRHIGRGLTVLDAGCGNGRVIRGLLESHINHYVGFDNCPEMIAAASSLDMPDCRFYVDDILGFEEKGFDTVFTVRAVINILDADGQEKAVRRLVEALKPGGRVILVEPTLQGLARINELRAAADLEQITVPWHNLYLDEDRIMRRLTEDCDVTTEHFASAYYLTSRLYYAYECKLRGAEMEYESPMNLMGEGLPPFGDFAPHRMFIGKKRQPRSHREISSSA